MIWIRLAVGMTGAYGLGLVLVHALSLLEPWLLLQLP